MWISCEKQIGKNVSHETNLLDENLENLFMEFIKKRRPDDKGRLRTILKEKLEFFSNILKTFKYKVRNFFRIGIWSYPVWNHNRIKTC